jgi:hypothetical protein
MDKIAPATAPSHGPSLAVCPNIFELKISGSGLCNRTGEMQRWKLAEQIAASVLGAQGPWPNGAQATPRPYLPVCLRIRPDETWASLSGHGPSDGRSKFHAMPHIGESHILWRRPGGGRGPKSTPPPTIMSFLSKHQNWNVAKWTSVRQCCWLLRLAAF